MTRLQFWNTLYKRILRVFHIEHSSYRELTVARAYHASGTLDLPDAIIIAAVQRRRRVSKSVKYVLFF